MMEAEKIMGSDGWVMIVMMGAIFISGRELLLPWWGWWSSWWCAMWGGDEGHSEVMCGCALSTEKRKEKVRWFCGYALDVEKMKEKRRERVVWREFRRRRWRECRGRGERRLRKKKGGVGSRAMAEVLIKFFSFFFVFCWWGKGWVEGIGLLINFSIMAQFFIFNNTLSSSYNLSELFIALD